MTKNKKLQIFLSSTYIDLVKERQAAVEAILNSSNIPAGMELFTAGNETQLEVIKRWIDDSDVYCLILGVRYGSINASLGLSYTEIEYRYAADQNKPTFAIVLAKDQIDSRLLQFEKDDPEFSKEVRAKYVSFREYVLSKICKFFHDEKDIKISIMESIMDFIRRLDFAGWIKGNEIPDYDSLLRENAELKNEIILIKQEKEKVGGDNVFGEYTFNEMKKMLINHSTMVPAEYSNTKKPFESNLLERFIKNIHLLNVGVNNAGNASPGTAYVFYNIGSPLLSYGLTVEVKVPNVLWIIIKTSALGFKFIQRYNKANTHKKA